MATSTIRVAGFTGLVCMPIPPDNCAKIIPKVVVKLDQLFSALSSTRSCASGAGGGSSSLERILEKYLRTNGLIGAYERAISNGSGELIREAVIEISEDGRRWEQMARTYEGLVFADWIHGVAYYFRETVSNHMAFEFDQRELAQFKQEFDSELSSLRDRGGYIGNEGSFMKFGYGMTIRDDPMYPSDRKLMIVKKGSSLKADDCRSNFMLMRFLWPLWSIKYGLFEDASAGAGAGAGAGASSGGSRGSDCISSAEDKASEDDDGAGASKEERLSDDIYEIFSDKELWESKLNGYMFSDKKDMFVKLARCFFLGMNCGIVNIF